MATIDQVISTADVRAGIGSVGTTEDGLIARAKSSAVKMIEYYINRHLTDKTITTDVCDFSYMMRPSVLRFRISDVKSDRPLTLRYAMNDTFATGTGDQTMVVTPDNDRRVSVHHDQIDWYAEDGAPWTGIMSLEHPTPTITAEVGMRATDIPTDIQDAVILIVRAIYDGSAYDKIEHDSILGALLKHYRPWRGQTARVDR